MTSEHRLERLVADALLASAPVAAPSLVPDILEAARKVRRRPRWLALMTERPMRRHPDILVGSPVARTATAMLVAAIVIVMGAGALVAGGIVLKPDFGLVVQPSDPLVEATPPGPVSSESPAEPSPAPRAGLVAYNVESRKTGCPQTLGVRCGLTSAWLSNADGSGARRLFPDDNASRLVLGWSGDGSQLLYSIEDSGLVLTTAATGSVLHRFPNDALCAYPSGTKTYSPATKPGLCTGADGFALSPDASRVAFVRSSGNDANSTIVAILDIPSGNVTELDATRTINGSQRCWESPSCEGLNDMPRWSPDGTRLVFARQSMSPEPGSSWTSSAVLVIDADGTNLRRLTPEGTSAHDPSWSPDRTTVLFVMTEMLVNSDHTSVTGMRTDVYTVRSDGTDLRRLTDDGLSYLPRWTADGHVTFARGTATWLVDSNGTGLTKLGSSFADLTAAGCMACRHPLATGESRAQNLAFWQPLP